MTRKITAIVAALAMVLSLLPLTALPSWAAEGVPYVDADGKGQTANNVTEIDSSTTTWSDGWYVVNSDVSIDGQITVSGDVKVILADGKTLTINGSVTITDNNRLTIYGQSAGTGRLYVEGDAPEDTLYEGGTGNAGIHVGDGALIINGAKVEAKGGAGGNGGWGWGNGGAGGHGGAGIAIQNGSLTVNGGMVNATGGVGGPGNAGLSKAHPGGNGAAGITNENGTITINSGMVAAIGGKGGTGAAASGKVADGGNGGAGIASKNNGSVTINDGTVSATGGAGGNAYGISYYHDADGGAGGAGIISENGSTTINSGTVTTTGGKGGTPYNNGKVGNTGSGIGGAFGTESGGDAIIKASSIDDNGDKNDWRGIIFDGSSGGVYGNQTLQENLKLSDGQTFIIPENTTLTVSTGKTLTVPENSTLTLDGELKLEGDFELKGTLVGTGTITPEKNRPTPQITITSDPLGKTYDGQPATVSSDNYTYNGNGTVTAVWYADENKSQKLDTAPTDAGTYWLAFSADATGLYQAAESDAVAYTIGQATPNPDTPSGLTATYGDTLSDIADQLPEGWTWDKPDTAVGDVGENTFAATYKKDNSGNYEAVKKTLTVTVNKANQTTKPTIDSTTATADTITVTASGKGQGDYQYAIVEGAGGTAPTDAKEWKANSTFENLKAATAYTVFVRYAGDDNHHPSAASEGKTVYTAYATPAVNDGYTIDYAAETVKAKDGYELRLNDGDAWTSESIDIAPGTTFQVRQAANGDIPASAAQEVAAQKRPAVPEATVDGANETLKLSVDSEYSLDDGKTWRACGKSVALATLGWTGAEKTVQIRAAAVKGTSFASAKKEVTIPARQSAPSVTIDYSKETVSTTAQMQWRAGDDGAWQNCEDNMSLAAIGWKGAEINVQLRTKASGDVAASEVVKFTIPARPAASEATVNGVNETLNFSDDSEYSLDNGQTWQKGGQSVALADLGWTGAEKTVQIRAAAVAGKSFASAAKDVTIPARNIAPSVTIDYSKETVNTTDKMEWSTDGQTWKDCASGMTLSDLGWDGTKNVTVQIRTKAAGATVASQILKLDIPARPAAPEATINGANETLDFTVDSEYSLDNGQTWTAGGKSVALATLGWTGEEKTVKIRAAAVAGKSFASAAKPVIIPVRQSAPSVTIDYRKETVNTTDKMEWSTDGKTWTGCTDDMTLADLGWTGAATTVQIRTKAAGATVASQIKNLDIPARPSAPTSVVGSINTLSGLTTDMEYSRDGKTWAAVTGTSMELTAGDYYVRYKATDKNFASESVKVTVKPYNGKYSYETTVTQPEHGKISVDKYVTEGENVTITVTPDEGYAVDSVTVTAKNDKTVDVTKNADGTYSFTMPKSNVTITATLVESDEPAPEPQPEPSDLPFTDISAGAWYYDPVRFVYSEGLMTGTSATTFSPNLTTTRGMIVAILYRMEGEPDISNENLGVPFADVDANAYYADAVYWARLNGIVSGYSSESFGPTDSITREQLAAILYNYAEYKGVDTSARNDLSAYTDAGTISGWATDAMQWANAEGIVGGMTTTELAPKGNATRAQVAAMLERYVKNVLA